ncbi:UNKNOWN [Stylonychia lemnae]|uniref:Uncharacterized protein n=1 Tax=Stylonychia lemnae TaxID=5949 RepID=A0A078BB05_STYLE|nr:UNKNOWN [Stylonychia lemnae]|eukprot:CDW91755.1 UNKNOWN [Stylonychia lemnae]
MNGDQFEISDVDEDPFFNTLQQRKAANAFIFSQDFSVSNKIFEFTTLQKDKLPPINGFAFNSGFEDYQDDADAINRRSMQIKSGRQNLFESNEEVKMIDYQSYQDNYDTNDALNFPNSMKARQGKNQNGERRSLKKINRDSNSLSLERGGIRLKGTGKQNDPFMQTQSIMRGSMMSNTSSNTNELPPFEVVEDIPPVQYSEQEPEQLGRTSTKRKLKVLVSKEILREAERQGKTVSQLVKELKKQGDALHIETKYEDSNVTGESRQSIRKSVVSDSLKPNMQILGRRSTIIKFKISILSNGSRKRKMKVESFNEDNNQDSSQLMSKNSDKGFYSSKFNQGKSKKPKRTSFLSFQNDGSKENFTDTRYKKQDPLYFGVHLQFLCQQQLWDLQRFFQFILSILSYAMIGIRQQDCQRVGLCK